MLYCSVMVEENQHRSSERRVILAIVGAAHGLRGEVRVRSFTEDPLAFGNYGPLTGSDGRSYRVLSARPAGNMVIARLEGIGDRAAAEALNGLELSVHRSALGSPAGDEYYHADLIGLKAVDPGGNDYGKVVAIHNFGAGDVLELRRDGKASRMIPFSGAAVPSIEPEAGRIVIDPVAAGLTGDGDG
jgi:16S rRNA processing protein RimM